MAMCTVEDFGSGEAATRGGGQPEVTGAGEAQRRASWAIPILYAAIAI